MMVEAKTDAPAPRKRGRPRTVTDDQQVPERRRKQLRVAQQAYRKRKETTIINLQSRVKDLETGIEELSESFLSFSNLLLEAEILQNYPQVTAALQKITQQCVSLARRGSEEPEEAVSAETTPTPPGKLSPSQEAITNVNCDTLISPLNSEPLPVFDSAFHSSQELLDQWPVAQQLPPTPPYQDQAVLPFGIVLSSPNNSFLSNPDLSLSFPSTISPSNFIGQGRWSLSHLLVRQCCERGYRLLTSSSSDDPRILEIFGKPLTTAERNILISGFYAALHDEVGDTIELKTKVLSPLYSKRTHYSPELLSISSRMWQLVTESGAEEWLDASGVQRLIQEKGIRIEETSSPSTSPRFNSAPQLNVTSFVKFLSSMGAVCVGRGPAFRKRHVEKALRLAISKDPWAFDAVCEIP